VFQVLQSTVQFDPLRSRQWFFGYFGTHFVLYCFGLQFDYVFMKALACVFQTEPTEILQRLQMFDRANEVVRYCGVQQISDFNKVSD